MLLFSVFQLLVCIFAHYHAPPPLNSPLIPLPPHQLMPLPLLSPPHYMVRSVYYGGYTATIKIFALK